jgi:quinol monooxygenase YgiN
MILIVVKFPIRPEFSDSWPVRVADFTEGTRSEPGNVFFEWSRSIEEPDTYVLVEGFRDDDAGAAHVNSAHFKSAMAWMPETISAAPKIVNVKAPVDGWAAMAELSPAP